MSQRDTVIHLVAGGYVFFGLCVCDVNLDPSEKQQKNCLLCNSEIRTFGCAVFDVYRSSCMGLFFSMRCIAPLQCKITFVYRI